jgi:Xaa-Pro dipeptidase
MFLYLFVFQAGAPNERVMNAGETVLFDMGAEYHCYCADVTVCFPVNGRFDEDQKAIYSAVLAASRAVLAAMRPGISWLEMHRLAERVLLQELIKIGVVRGPLEELEAHHVGALFMPHGLGHLIGLDTHDVGGWPGEMQRPTEPGIRKLRNGRPLVSGMCITVEPGCYFIAELLLPALQTHGKWLVEEKIRHFIGKGGVRIEDVVLVTDTGCQVLSNELPRTVEEIEKFMAENNVHVKSPVNPK